MANATKQKPDPAKEADSTKIRSHPVNLKHETDHLRVFLTLYAVFFAFGLRHLLEGIYEDPHNHQLIIISISLLFIGVRLIFSPEALSFFLIEIREIHRSNTKNLPLFTVPFCHYSFLLGKAALFYCAIYYLIPPINPKETWHPNINEWAIKPILWLLAVDIIWLIWILLVTKGGSQTSVAGKIKIFWTMDPKVFWVINNSLFLLLAWYIVFNLKSDLCFFNDYFCFNPITCGFILIFFNSVLDFWFTAKWYIPRVREESNVKDPYDTLAPEENPFKATKDNLMKHLDVICKKLSSLTWKIVKVFLFLIILGSFIYAYFEWKPLADQEEITRNQALILCSQANIFIGQKENMIELKDLQDTEENRKALKQMADHFSTFCKKFLPEDESKDEKRVATRPG